jgi:hypothetical protein
VWRMYVHVCVPRLVPRGGATMPVVAASARQHTTSMSQLVDGGIVATMAQFALIRPPLSAVRVAFIVPTRVTSLANV